MADVTDAELLVLVNTALKGALDAQTVHKWGAIGGDVNRTLDRLIHAPGA